MNRHLEAILKKMCEMVSANFAQTNFNDPGWFLHYEWTQIEEMKCKKWMVDYLMQHPAAQKQLYLYVANKRKNEERAAIFLLDYGWKNKEV